MNEELSSQKLWATAASRVLAIIHILLSGRKTHISFSKQKCRLPLGGLKKSLLLDQLSTTWLESGTRSPRGHAQIGNRLKAGSAWRCFGKVLCHLYCIQRVISLALRAVNRWKGKRMDETYFVRFESYHIFPYVTIKQSCCKTFILNISSSSFCKICWTYRGDLLLSDLSSLVSSLLPSSDPFTVMILSPCPIWNSYGVSWAPIWDAMR